MLTKRKILRFEPIFIDILNKHVCQYINYSPGRCFTVMLSLFGQITVEQQSYWFEKAYNVSKQFKTHNSYQLIPVQIQISKKLGQLFYQNDDRIVIVAVLLYHDVLIDKKVGV